MIGGGTAERGGWRPGSGGTEPVDAGTHRWEDPWTDPDPYRETDRECGEAVRRLGMDYRGASDLTPCDERFTGPAAVRDWVGTATDWDDEY